jgi:hypothetical protein
MFKNVLALSLAIHLILLMLEYSKNEETRPSIDKDKKEQSYPIKLNLLKVSTKIKSTSKTHSPKPPVKNVFKKLQFSQKYFEKQKHVYDPSRINSLDPGGVKRNCLKSLISSSVHFPDFLFHNQISGVAGMRIIIKKDKIVLQQSKSDHPILSKLLCFHLRNQVHKISHTHCLNQKEIKGVHTIKARYSYGHKPFRAIDTGLRSYFFNLQRLKKKSPLRVLMAISNIFSLLELYQSREDKGITQAFLLNLQKLNCDNSSISI